MVSGLNFSYISDFISVRKLLMGPSLLCLISLVSRIIPHLSSLYSAIQLTTYGPLRGGGITYTLESLHFHLMEGMLSISPPLIFSDSTLL